MNKKMLTLLVVAIVGLPMAAAASTIENHGVVTGHTTYANMGGFDPNIAAIAGLAESKVVWFNGKTIFSATGDGFVYAVESGTPCDPVDGTNYTFQHYNLSYIDPNDQPHIVAHYTFQCDLGLSAGMDYVENQPLPIFNGPQVHDVWITITHNKTRDGPIQIQGNVAPGGGDAGRWYNFALAVDTSLFDSRDEGDVTHDGMGGHTTTDINEGNSYCEQDGDLGDHVCNEGTVEGEDTPHTHNSATVDLYFSKRDRGVNAGTDSGGSHPGTGAGCGLDPYCNSVQTGTYQDPTSNTNTTA